MGTRDLGALLAAAGFIGWVATFCALVVVGLMHDHGQRPVLALSAWVGAALVAALGLLAIAYSQAVISGAS